MHHFTPDLLNWQPDLLARAPFIWVPYPDRRLSPNVSAHAIVENRLRQNAKMHARHLMLEAMGRNHPWRNNDKPVRFEIDLHALPVVRRNRDDDNFIASFKAHRDGIAMALGVDDNVIRTGSVVFWPPAPKSRWRPGAVLQVRGIEA